MADKKEYLPKEKNIATIWKYEIVNKSIQQIELPENAQVLTVQLQDGFPCIWALVDSSKPLKTREFHLYGTGQPIKECDTLKYVGTFQMIDMGLVFHLFEKIRL